MAINEKDRLLGAYVHIPIVGSTLVPIIVWLLYREQKDKADLVFQAKQAAIFQVALGVLIGLFAIGSAVLSIIVPALGIIVTLLMFPLIGLFLLYALFAAWKVYSGDDFKYMIIGSMLKK